MSVPAGMDDENMPFGMQLYAGRLMDKKLLCFASEIDILA
jgi:Asp-tRNA(Asn)/Glu-tRNA(Gln) amidotransferase A subunit family amidase